jgi:cysteine-rich repeat protein
MTARVVCPLALLAVWSIAVPAAARRPACELALKVDGAQPVRRVVKRACGDTCRYRVQLCVNQEPLAAAASGCKPTHVDEIFVTGPAFLERPDLDVLGPSCGPGGDLMIRLGRKRRVKRARLDVVARARRPHRRREHESLTFVCEPSDAECCGDGRVGAGEECDPPDGATCDANCRTHRCGNGFRSADEQCDDGNQVDGDGCDADCTQGCGNGHVSLGEECDPRGTGQCGENQVCNADCRCVARVPCACPIDDGVLDFGIVDSANACGAVSDATGNELASLACNVLYVGGGERGNHSISLPVGGALAATLTGCSGHTVSLAGATREAVGGRECTTRGCFFGPPVPVVDPNFPRTSVCIVNAMDASLNGSLACPADLGGTWDVDLKLSLGTKIYSTGDLLPDVPGTQPCPLCVDGTCRGGTNDGGTCEPGTTANGRAYPTSQDCPPPGMPLGDELRLPFVELKTGLKVEDARENVFFGYCGSEVGCFEGDPYPSCPVPGTSTPSACSAPEQCLDPAYPLCAQRHGGAFGFARAAHIAVHGAPAEGNVADGTGHSAVLAGIWGVPPTFDGTVDATADLPGPAAVGLSATLRLRPATTTPAP